MTFHIPDKIIDNIGTFFQFSSILYKDDEVAELYSPHLKANLSWAITQIHKKDDRFVNKMFPMILAGQLNNWLHRQPNHYLFQFEIREIDEILYFTWKSGFNKYHTISFNICNHEELDKLFTNLP